MKCSVSPGRETRVRAVALDLISSNSRGMGPDFYQCYSPYQQNTDVDEVFKVKVALLAMPVQIKLTRLFTFKNRILMPHHKTDL